MSQERSKIPYPDAFLRFDNTCPFLSTMSKGGDVLQSGLPEIYPDPIILDDPNNFISDVDSSSPSQFRRDGHPIAMRYLTSQCSRPRHLS
jgi:hypothetical protein